MCSVAGTRRCGLLAAVATALLGSAACNEGQLPTAPSASESPSFLISDGANGGPNPHFFFLAPIQSNASFSGNFDPAVTPTVRICALSGSDCSGPDISTFSLTSTPPIVVNAAAENYNVQWKTNGLNLSAS